MKRLHIHLRVEDLAKSIRFYSTLFAAEPNVTKTDYAKWMLDYSGVNFAISTRSNNVGLDHLGIQVEDSDELNEIHSRLQHLQGKVTTEIGITCCYANSDKYWTSDPQGIAWEIFHTLNSIPVFGGGISRSETSCCTPALKQTPNNDSDCCVPLRFTKVKSETCC
jgi:catechol 2,3-dioxygenase-like lactoylglutathione lyase family enzyme